MPALFALDLGDLVAVGVGSFEPFLEGRIELGDEFVPILPLFDEVEFFFHIGGEPDVHNVGKILHEKIGDPKRHFGGFHVFPLFFDVFAFIEHRNDRGVRGRTADTLIFHRLDERRGGFVNF